ncbi:hypothetical protein JTE90_009137 [Oedothorax gibbosus]|uniref:Lipase domain-containing protein n=1 Tax=Oedothorax gibbosus TaxID=931172 RepID=A0AAV6TV38_9ARAC|nr:hypothetical protein JTE90_009137 [Oedothorax gibbosus]
MLLIVLSVLVCSSEAEQLDESNAAFTNSCISDLGCFYTGPPFYDPVERPISLPPSNRTDEVKFLLFTPESPVEAYNIKPDNESVQESVADSGLKTAILIHGFLTTMDKDDIRHHMKDAILRQGGYNVIIVDWTRLNGEPYAQAVANTRVVGALIAKLINLIMDLKGVQAESFYLIGHSLGAHVAGYAGERIKNLGRITGLDPAGPWFSATPPEVRLDPTDALFVDVIHTDASALVFTGFGIGMPIGHMDFYPNGGSHQPGCTGSSQMDNVIGTIINDTIRYTNPSCDHSRANELFLESIDDSRCRFLAVHCANYADFESGLCQPQAGEGVSEMGFHNKRIQGLKQPAKFYLKTNGQSPFCNEDSIKIAEPKKQKGVIDWFHDWVDRLKRFIHSLF